jgi:amino acid permease
MSEQWLAVISFIPLLALLFIKNLKLIVKLTAIGIYSVLVYFIFIGYVFIDNIKNIKANDIKLFSFDIGNLAGTCALAFTIHTIVAPISKMNRNQERNSKNLYITYILGCIIYSFIGICGQLAIQGKF